MKIISKHTFNNEIYELIYEYWICLGFNPNKAEEILKKLETQYKMSHKDAKKLFKEYFNNRKII